MTDRYVLTRPEAVARRFKTREQVRGKPNFNLHRELVVPTISYSRATGNHVVNRFFGYIPPWEGTHEPTCWTIARSEGAHEAKTFRDAFQTGRCLAVADGCYVWEDKQPYFLRLRSRELFGIAAISSVNAHFRPALNSFCLLTVFPNELVAQVHRRMVVILRPEDEAAYLDPATPLEDVRALLMPYPAEAMEMYPVTPELNKAKHSARKFVQPLDTQSSWQESSGQLSLLDES